MILLKQGSRNTFFAIATLNRKLGHWAEIPGHHLVLNGALCLLICFNKAFSSLIEVGDSEMCLISVRMSDFSVGNTVSSIHTQVKIVVLIKIK